MAEPGELIARRYRLVDRIAVGGMGVVWEGWDELLARRVAVKQLLTQPGLSEADAMLARNRMIREARITARLHHPHAVTIYDVVDHGDSPCLIMQYVPSNSLNTVLRDKGTLTPATVGRIGADLASALRAAHEVGIVHRDVKPGNVLITGDGSAKLTDFGISHAHGDVTLTSTGMVSGTPAYLAPEVARGGESGFPADVFSLGATLYASLEGTPPFGLDPNPMAVLHRVASGQMIPPQRSGPLTPLLLAMMAPEPADRPTMAEVSRTLTLPLFEAPQGRAPEPGAVRTTPVSRSELSAALAVTGGSPTGRRPGEPGAGEPRVGDPRTDEPRAAVPRAGDVRPVEPRAGESGVHDPRDSGQPAVGQSRTGDPRIDEPRAGEPPALAALMAPRSTSASKPARTDRSPRRAGALLAVAAVVLAGVLAAGFLLLREGDTDPGSVAATTVQDLTGQSAAASSGGGPQDSATDTAAPTSTSVSVAADPAAAELVAAVSDYYALMPGDTDAGWELLTPSFQSGIAQNREYYNSFWAGVERVEVADATGTPPGTVEATVTYHFTDGSVSVERTAYQLVDDGGVLKIDSSTVLSSQAG